MRYVAFTITLFLAMPARAQETTVWFTILARGGTEEVEIGPDGGLVPYRLWMETDPLGTPGNFGILAFQFTIETNLGVEQAPLQRELPPFLAGGVGGRIGGAVEEDDLGLGASPRCRTGPCGGCFRTGIGQSGPQPIGRGHFIVPATPIGTEFHARVVTEPHNEADPRALVLTALRPGATCGVEQIGEFLDRVLGNTLTIRVVQAPVSPADFDRDDDVDLPDYLRFLQSFACPDGPTAFGCDAGDLDWDGDVDLADVVAFQSEFTGSQ